MKILFVTTGDPDGVGLEVTVKALNLLKPKRAELIVVLRSDDHYSDRLMAKLRSWKTQQLAEIPTDFSTFKGGQILDLRLGTHAVEWFEFAVKYAAKNPDCGIVTGPLSKTSIKAAGRRDVGHTEILERLCKAHVLQGYLGTKFHVLLASAHSPLKKAPSVLTKKKLSQVLATAQQLRGMLPLKFRKRKIALLGMNPHAGEGGIIGNEELSWRSVLKSYKRDIAGPLVPDAAFRPENWNRYALYVACYHDQGLIPFKMIHGSKSGAQISLGLPFVRTSVDHGTAKEIYGRNQADHGSMLDAIQWCRHLTKTK